jgi:hypothetical protein
MGQRRCNCKPGVRIQRVCLARLDVPQLSVRSDYWTYARWSSYCGGTKRRLLSDQCVWLPGMGVAAPLQRTAQCRYRAYALGKSRLEPLVLFSQGTWTHMSTRSLICPFCSRTREDYDALENHLTVWHSLGPAEIREIWRHYPSNPPDWILPACDERKVRLTQGPLGL